MAEAETLAFQMSASLNLHKRRKFNHNTDVTAAQRATHLTSARKRTIAQETKKKSSRAGSRGATSAYVDSLLQETAERERQRPPKPAYGRFVADEIDKYPAPEFYDANDDLLNYYTQTEWIRKREQGVIEKRKAEHLDEAEALPEIRPTASKKRRLEERSHDPPDRTTPARPTTRKAQPKPTPRTARQSSASKAGPQTDSLTRKRTAENVSDDEDNPHAARRKKHKTSQGPTCRLWSRDFQPTQLPSPISSTSLNNDVQAETQPVTGDDSNGHAEFEADFEDKKPTDAPKSAEATTSKDVSVKHIKRKLHEMDEFDVQSNTARRKVLKTAKKWRGVAVGKEQA